MTKFITLAPRWYDIHGNFHEGLGKCPVCKKITGIYASGAYCVGCGSAYNEWLEQIAPPYKMEVVS